MKKCSVLSPSLLLNDNSRTLKFGKCDVLVAYGEYDSPEFRRQSDEFVGLVNKYADGLDMKVSWLMLEDEDHFSVIEKCDSLNYPLSRKILSFIAKNT